MRVGPRGLVLSVAAIAAATAAQAANVSDWQNPANYPARVNAIVWNDQRLDGNTPAHFGTWTIYLDSRRPPVAEHDAELGGNLTAIYIGTDPRGGALRCVNAVAGEHKCVINATRVTANPNNPTTCQFGLIGTPKTFRMPCPTALDLQR